MSTLAPCYCTTISTLPLPHPTLYPPPRPHPQTTALKEMEYRNSELQELVVEKEAALEAQQLDFDRKRTALEMKHTEATDWLFRVTCTCPIPRTHPTLTVPRALLLLVTGGMWGEEEGKGLCAGCLV